MKITRFDLLLATCRMIPSPNRRIRIPIVLLLVIVGVVTVHTKEWVSGLSLFAGMLLLGFTWRYWLGMPIAYLAFRRLKSFPSTFDLGEKGVVVSWTGNTHLSTIAPRLELAKGETFDLVVSGSNGDQINPAVRKRILQIMEALRKQPNQALLPTSMAVTSAAAHLTRQP